MKFDKSTFGAILVASLVQCRAFTILSNNRLEARLTNDMNMDRSILWTNVGISRTKRGNTYRLKMAAQEDDEDDYEGEDEDPLGDGVNSVKWLPSITATDVPATESSEESEVLPFFPLGGIVYTPNTEHVLNIFEPRYRKMYTDILMNGSKRFVVAMSHPEEPGVFAQTGVIFYLDDLKEVSEETGDQIKYICTHKVTERVKLEKILNPEVYSTRESYLKVQGLILKEDEDDEQEEQKEAMDENVKDDVYQQLVGAISKTAPNSPAEKALKASFSNLVHLQHELEEDVRFTRASIVTLAIVPGNGEDGLWQTIRLWQSFIEQRLVSRQNEMQMEFQEKLIEFLKKDKGLDDNELPSAIGFDDLSPQLQQEVQDLQKRIAEELQPLVLESTLAIQKVLEADGHEERCKLLTHFMNAEKKRLDAKKQLQGMFSSAADVKGVGGVGEVGEIKKMVQDVDFDIDDKDEEEDGSSPSGSLLIDEPDAFQ